MLVMLTTLIDCLGLVLGGAWGFKEGVTRSLGSSPSFKLRLNSVLNGATRRGSYLGNSLGVLGESRLRFYVVMIVLRGRYRRYRSPPPLMRFIPSA